MIQTVLLFPWNPCEATRRIKNHPVLWPSLILTFIVGIASLHLRWPWVIEASIQHLPNAAGASDRDWVRAVLSEDVVARSAIFPLIFGLKLFAFSLLVFLLSRMAPSAFKPRFSVIMILCAHAAFLQEFGELIALLVGWNPLQNAGAGIPGVAWFYSGGSNYLTRALIRSLNVLTLWNVTALTAGFYVLFGGSILRSCFIAVAAWAVAVLANLWMIRLMQDALHLRI